MHTPARSASRFTTRLLALGAVAAMALPSMAAPKMSSDKMGGSKMSSSTMSKKSTQMTGTVLSKTATSLTIKPARKANGATKTIAVTATTPIMMGKEKCSLDMCKPGDKVTVRMNGAGTVTSIMCMPTKGMKAMKSSSKMSGSKMSGSKMGKM
jgi:hypothetical protein